MEKQITEHYKKNYKVLLKFSIRFLKDHSYAEDVVQETYHNALKYQDSFDQGSDLDKWIRAIHWNTLRKMSNEIKEAGVTMEVDLHKFPVDVFPRDPDKLINLKELIEKSPITKEEKKALTLWAINGYTSEDCRILTGISGAQLYKVWRHMKERAGEVL